MFRRSRRRRGRRRTRGKGRSEEGEREREREKTPQKKAACKKKGKNCFNNSFLSSVRENPFSRANSSLLRAHLTLARPAGRKYPAIQVRSARLSSRRARRELERHCPFAFFLWRLSVATAPQLFKSFSRALPLDLPIALFVAAARLRSALVAKGLEIASRRAPLDEEGRVILLFFSAFRFRFFTPSPFFSTSASTFSLSSLTPSSLSLSFSLPLSKTQQP